MRGYLRCPKKKAQQKIANFRISWVKQKLDLEIEDYKKQTNKSYQYDSNHTIMICLFVESILSWISIEEMKRKDPLHHQNFIKDYVIVFIYY